MFSARPGSKISFCPSFFVSVFHPRVPWNLLCRPDQTLTCSSPPASLSQQLRLPVWTATSILLGAEDGTPGIAWLARCQTELHPPHTHRNQFYNVYLTSYVQNITISTCNHCKKLLFFLFTLSYKSGISHITNVIIHANCISGTQQPFVNTLTIRAYLRCQVNPSTTSPSLLFFSLSIPFYYFLCVDSVEVVNVLAATFALRSSHDTLCP